MDIKQDANAKGILLMVFSMAAMASADTLIKASSSFLSPAQILFFLTGGTFFLFAAMAISRKEKLLDARMFSKTLLFRYLTEVVGMIGVVMALTYVPLSAFGAISQAAPILVALGAVLFLEEKMSWRRWCSMGVGFIGVLCVVQPGTGEFDVAVLWAVLAVVASSARDLVTRLTPPGISSASLAAYTMAAALPFAGGWVILSGESLIPAQVDWLVVAGMVALGAFGYVLLISSIRIAEISAVMPFRYSRMLFILILGFVVFEERPGVLMMTGAALIVASGLYIIWRERQAAPGIQK